MANTGDLYDDYLLELGAYREKHGANKTTKAYTLGQFYEKWDSDKIKGMASNEEKVHFLVRTNVKASEAQMSAIVEYLERTHYEGHEYLLNEDGTYPNEKELEKRIMETDTVGGFMAQIKSDDEFTDEEGDLIFYGDGNGGTTNTTGLRQLIKTTGEQLTMAQKSAKAAQAKVQELEARIAQLEKENAALKAGQATNGAGQSLSGVKPATLINAGIRQMIEDSGLDADDVENMVLNMVKKAVKNTGK